MSVTVTWSGGSFTTALWLCRATQTGNVGREPLLELCAFRDAGTFAGAAAAIDAANAYLLPDDESAAAHPLDELLAAPLAAQLEAALAAALGGSEPARATLVLSQIAAHPSVYGDVEAVAEVGKDIARRAVSLGEARGAAAAAEAVVAAARQLLALVRAMVPGSSHRVTTDPSLADKRVHVHWIS